MGGDPPRCQYTGGFPPQGGLTVGRSGTVGRYVGYLVIPAPCSSDVGSGSGGGGDIRPTALEYHLPIYRDFYNIISIYGGGAASGSSAST